MLKHDDDGFLVGTPIKPQGNSDFARVLGTLAGIKADTAAIRAALLGGSRQRYRVASNADSYARRRYTPRSRDAAGRFAKRDPQQAANDAVVADVAGAVGTVAPRIARTLATAMQKAAEPIGESTAAAVSDAVERAAKVRQRGKDGRFTSSGASGDGAGTASRDSRGRFVGGGKGGEDGDDGSDTSRRKRDGLWSRIAERFSQSSNSLSDIADTAENIDPTAAAAKEVAGLAGSVLSPLGDGIKGVVGLVRGGDEKDEAIPWYRRIWKELRESNKKQDSKGGSSVFGILAAVLMAIVTMPAKLGKALLGMLPGMGGSGSGVSGALSGAGRLARMGKFLRRAGPIAALFGVGKMLFDENDSSLTREQKNAKHFRTGGATIGSLLGGALGTLAGPIGTMAGASIGGIVGEKVGAWLSEVKWSEVAGKMSAAWDSSLKAFDGVLSTMADKLKSAGNAANDAIKRVTGVDVKKTTVAAAKSTASAVSSAGSWAKSKLGALISRGEGDYDSYNTGTKGVAGGRVGYSGKKNLSAMSINEILASSDQYDGNDKRRVFAAGRYQVIAPTLRAAVKKMGLTGEEKFTPELQDRIFNEALMPPAARDYITGKSTNKQAALVAMAQQWRSVADPRTGKTYADAGAKANKASITAEEMSAALDEARAGGNPAVLNRVANTAVSVPATKPIPLAFKAATTVSAASPVNPRINAAIAPAKVPAPPPERTPIASNGKGSPQTVVVAGHDVGQNLSDRGIAQLTTGGMGAYTARH